MSTLNTNAPIDEPPMEGETIEIPIRSGRAFQIKKGQYLTVIDPLGGQVSDLLAFNAVDTKEVLSSGRTLDYASRIYLTTGDVLYSNRSNVMLRIKADTVGKHDFLLTPCSKRHIPHHLWRQRAPPRLFRQSGSGAWSLWHHS